MSHQALFVSVSVIQDQLKPNQIEEIINFDLQFRLQQINDPELLDILREKINSDFLKEQRENECYLNNSKKDNQLEKYI